MTSPSVGLPTRRLFEEAFGGAELTDVTGVLEATKAVKTERELEKLGIANEIAGFGMLAFKEAARPGRTEVEIAAGVRLAAEESRLVVEPSGALTVAAIAFRSAEAGLDRVDGPVVAVVSGGNVDPERYRELLATPLPARG